MALATLCSVAGLLGPVIEVAKLIAAPVRHQFSYLCCFSSNVDTLRDEARKLDDETRGVQMRVDAATNNAQLILPQVETWLTNSNEMRNETDGILDEALNVGNGCWKVGERYSLSRKAKKKSRAIKELLEWCNFSNVSHPPPIAATAPLASGTTTYEFDSRREIEGEIMKTLESKDVHKIGICGMGGVGKTTMVQMMMNRALKEGLFDEVVIAVVSQSVEKLKIQHLISFGNLQKLGLWRDTKSKNLWCDQIPFGFFRGLVELYIHDCSKIRRLFSSTSGIPQNLVNLHKLRIARCVEMVKVIEDEDVYPTKHSLFPSLQELELDCLPTLKCFCECDIELLSLTKLEIEWCNGMKDFISAGSLTAPALQTIRLNSRDMECIDDLTAALHKVFDENKCDLVRLAQLTAQTQALRPEDCHIL